MSENPRPTTRERRERRAERLREWADGRDAKADERHQAATAITGQIPMGQPILVGHHSQRRHENALTRADNAMRASVEHADKARGMRQRADGIEAQNAASIYSDDPDAVERLEEKINAEEKRRDAMKQANAAYRRQHRARLAAMSAWDRNQAVPHPSWEVSNLTANIARMRKRLKTLKAEREHGPTLRTMTARYPGHCSKCGAAIAAGQTIRYARQVGACCEEC